MLFGSNADEARFTGKHHLPLQAWHIVYTRRKERSSFRSARVFSFVLFSPFSFVFHNFMDSVNIATDESLFFGVAPAFDLMLPL